jgi:hypothetical protein
VRLPTGSEWAYIKSYANKRLGEGTWIASLIGMRSCDHTRKPKPGDIIRLRWIEEKPLIYSNSAKPTTQKIEEVQVISKADEPSDLPPVDWTGDLKAPLKKVQIRTQRPLHNGEESLLTPKRVIVELAVPPIEILKPVLEKPLDEGKGPRLLSLEEVHWKSEYWQKSMESYIRLRMAMDSRLTSAQMLKTWEITREKIDSTHLLKEYHQGFWKALRIKQSEEWDKMMSKDIFGCELGISTQTSSWRP